MKRILKITGLLILAVNLFSSCSDFSVSDETEKKSVNAAIENINSEIVLGEKFENLFTVEKAQERAVEGEIIEANYMYFRCRSDNEDDIKWLSEKFDVLSIIPLDREILEGGTIYKDPELSEDEAPWFYLMKPIEDYNEVVSRGISAEVLDEMYLDDEDIALLSGEGLEIPDDTYLTVDLEDESARFGGWLKKKLKKIIKKYVANYPKGKVQVLDTITRRICSCEGRKSYVTATRSYWN